MSTSYVTTVIGSGNDASLEIPDENLAQIGANRRAPLKVTINGHTYQSTATGVDGKCMVVFPMRDRAASNVTAGETVTVTLELDDGYRHVSIPQLLADELAKNNLEKTFHDLTYSKRREFARSVQDAKTDGVQVRRTQTIIDELRNMKSL